MLPIWITDQAHNDCGLHGSPFPPGVSAGGRYDEMSVKSCRCISHSVWLLVGQLMHFTDNTRSKPALSLDMEMLACGSVSWASANVCAAIDGSTSMNDPHGCCRL